VGHEGLEPSANGLRERAGEVREVAGITLDSIDFDRDAVGQEWSGVDRDGHGIVPLSAGRERARAGADEDRRHDRRDHSGEPQARARAAAGSSPVGKSKLLVMVEEQDEGADDFYQYRSPRRSARSTSARLAPSWPSSPERALGCTRSCECANACPSPPFHPARSEHKVGWRWRSSNPE
jgi:hypothetical protein